MIETKDIPKHWQKKKLGEVCEVLDNLRKPINSTERQQRISGKSQEELYPYYGATGQVGWIDDFLTDGDFILIGEDGAPFLDIYKDKAYKIKGKTWVNNHAHILKGKEQFLLDDFALHYLNSINYREFVNGTTRLKLTKSSLVEIPFVVPPLPEQQAIVSKIEQLLSELENGKQQLLTAQQQLKVYRQSLLKWAFEGKLTNNNVKDGELPKGWKWVKVAEISNVVRGGSPRPAGDPKYYEGNIPFLKVRDITKDNEMFLTTFEYTIKEAGLHKTRQITPNTLLLSNSGATLGVPKICMIEATMNDGIAAFLDLDERSLKYLYYFWLSKTKELRNINMGAAQPNLNTDIIKSYLVPYCSFEDQQLIVSELESKLTVCDKIEETIRQSLLQAETLKQSILKKAFEGKLVTALAEQKETKVIPLYKPKNEYFYQMQLLGIVAKASKQKQIEHGEMTLAKYAYLIDKVYDVPTYFNYNRWHLGPYPPTIKKVINNKQYFKKSGNHIEVLNEKTLFNSTNPNTEKMQVAVNDLTDIFSKYTVKERSHKTELLATVCKVIEDIQSTDLKVVRQSMAEWKINLKGEKHKTKAEKFNEAETKNCLAFIKEKGWDKKLMK